MNMHQVYVSTIPTIWAVFAISVLFALGKQKPAVRRQSAAARFWHGGLIVVMPLLMGLPRLPLGFLNGRFLPWHPINFWIGTTLVVVGLSLATYCRHFLKGNWSITAEVKQSHELVRSGPYRYVRHPIYAGLLLAVMGSALTIGQWRGLIGFMIACAVLWAQSRIEERYMTETFGEGYRQYQREVPPLVPFVRWTHANV
jgi:protein-S-isoprenylcysteine O-methyltransferase Ste14